MRKLTIGSLLLVLAGGGVAGASPQLRQTADIEFGNRSVDSSTGIDASFSATDPGNPGGKPSPARRVVVTLARGSEIDTRIPRVCGATDRDFASEGARACPRSSRVGEGTAEATTGIQAIDPIRENVTAFNGRNQLILYLTPAGGAGQTLVIRGRVRRGRILDVSVPPLPLPGGQEASLTKLDLELDARSRVVRGEREHYLTTPERCGRTRQWTNTSRFTYADGTSKTVRSRSRCRRPRS